LKEEEKKKKVAETLIKTEDLGLYHVKNNDKQSYTNVCRTPGSGTFSCNKQQWF
jgi:hypothetical protein